MPGPRWHTPYNTPPLAAILNTADESALLHGIEFAPAQAYIPPPEINLAEHRIRRKQVLGGLIHEYQIAA